MKVYPFSNIYWYERAGCCCLILIGIEQSAKCNCVFRNWPHWRARYIDNIYDAVLSTKTDGTLLYNYAGFRGCRSTFGNILLARTNVSENILSKIHQLFSGGARATSATGRQSLGAWRPQLKHWCYEKLHKLWIYSINVMNKLYLSELEDLSWSINVMKNHIKYYE